VTETAVRPPGRVLAKLSDGHLVDIDGLPDCPSPDFDCDLMTHQLFGRLIANELDGKIFADEGLRVTFHVPDAGHIALMDPQHLTRLLQDDRVAVDRLDGSLQEGRLLVSGLAAKFYLPQRQVFGSGRRHAQG
jgi:hypothetical protein